MAEKTNKLRTKFGAEVEGDVVGLEAVHPDVELIRFLNGGSARSVDSFVQVRTKVRVGLHRRVKSGRGGGRGRGKERARKVRTCQLAADPRWTRNTAGSLVKELMTMPDREVMSRTRWRG